jgi:hypothetical protein
MCQGWDASALVLVPRCKEDVRRMQAFNYVLRNQQINPLKHKVRGAGRF